MNLQLPYKFIISPANGKQYVDEIIIAGKKILACNSIEDAVDVNRIAVVRQLPKNYNGNVKIGDLVVTQHNVMRIVFDDKGIPTQSDHFIKDDLFSVTPDLIYLIIRNGEFIATDQFVFIEPIEVEEFFYGKRTLENIGIAKFINSEVEKSGVKVGDKIIFRKFANYLFEIFGMKLYMMQNSRVLAVVN
jgi:hypothetical protein